MNNTITTAEVMDRQLRHSQRIERQLIAFEAAKAVCLRGYDPDFAAGIVRMDGETLARLKEWYAKWSA